MDLQAAPVIMAVDRVGGGIVVKFADGRCLFFSALVLQELADKGISLDEQTMDW